MNARSHREPVQRALLSSPLISSLHGALTSRGFVTRLSLAQHLSPSSSSLSLSLPLSLSLSFPLARRARYIARYV